MKINKNKFKSIIASIFLLVLVIGAAYAYLGTFKVDLSNDIAVNINSTSPGNTSFVANATQLNLQVPASSMGSYLANNTVAAMENNAVLSVSLQGANGFKTTCTYDIVYEYDSSSLVYGSSNAPVTSGATKEITLQIENVTGTNYYETERNFNYYTGSYNGNANDKWTSSIKRTLVSGATIESTGTSTSQSINVIGRYYNLDTYQDLGGKAFNGTIYVENVNCSVEENDEKPLYGYETILLNNAKNASSVAEAKSLIEAKENPDFSTFANTDEGMYATEDDLGISYYFRGAIENNWVKFGKYTSDTNVYYTIDENIQSDVYAQNGNLSNTCDGNDENGCDEIAKSGDDMYWRIIRINGDGSIRMIYTGNTSPTEDQKVYGLTDNVFALSETFNNITGPEGAGYMYEIGNLHGTSVSSNAKKIIDDWYANYTDLVNKSKYISDEIICNDRTAYSDENGNNLITSTSYNGNYYFASYIRKNNNLPSLKCINSLDKFTVNNDIGNGKLTYPVGLVNYDEIMYAGSNFRSGWFCNKNYLCFLGFSVTPSDLLISSNESVSMGNITVFPNILEISSLYPVISLSSDVVLTGDGTWNNPYEVVS